jgi:hypothetical protein
VETEGTPERGYAYQAAMLNRAVGVLEARAVANPANGCSGTGTRFGSSSLTSDTRLTTAFHNAVGLLPGEQIQVAFESPGQANPIGFYVDDVFSPFFPTSREDLTFRSGVSEENPLLPNRLFQFGLSDWTDITANRSQRNAIRTGWLALPDIIQGGPSSTFFNQGFVASLPGSLKGDDVAILKITGNSSLLDFSSSLLSGPFPSDRPAAFFGRTDLQPFKEHIPALGSKNAYLLHSPPWPDDGPLRVPVVSLPGIMGSDRTDVVSQVCDGTQLKAFQKQNLFTTSHDARPGSSGGILINPNQWTVEGEPLTRALVGTGVYSGALTDTLFWLSGNDPNLEEPTEDFQQTITMVSEMASQQSKRDPSSTGDPNFPDALIIGTPPKCLEEDDGNCLEWDVVMADLPSGAFPAPNAPVVGEGAERPGPFARKVFCRHGEDVGAMIGLSGGLAIPKSGVKKPTADISKMGAIGSLMSVCEPFSQTSYVENWRYVTVIGAQMEREFDTLGGQTGYGLFDEYMSRVYEERTEDGRTYVRPPSTKLCPPNYAMTGVSLGVIDKNYSGVERLHCVKTTTTGSSPEYLEVTTISKQGGYTLGGNEFSLTQYIGNPECVGNCRDFLCPASEPVVVGMLTDHDNQRRLKSFRLICAAKP